MLNNPALSWFRSINSYSDLESLIKNGEAEGQFLECKAPKGSFLDKGLKSQLKDLVSGFSNSGGGIIIWGVSTIKKLDGLDYLSQIEPIGCVKEFIQAVNIAIPVLSNPYSKFESKIILEKETDKRGAGITFISPTEGDPIQACDGKFYLRSRDEIIEMPYETVKRMFSGGTSPNLTSYFNKDLVKLETDGSWKIPIILVNESSAAAKDAMVSVVIENFSACENVSGSLTNASDINPGKKIFMYNSERPIHRGLNSFIGHLLVKMKKIKRDKRILKLSICIYATNMRARETSFTIQLAKKGFAVKKVKQDFLY